MNEYYEVEGDKNIVLLDITGNKNDGEIFIDYEDYERVSNYLWYIKDGYPNQYIATTINKKEIKLHRFLMKVDNRKIIVDHRDRDTFNNRKSNLRKTNSSINNLNASFSKNNTSGRTGVCYNKGVGTRSDKWVAHWQVNEKKKSKSFSIKKYGYEEARLLAEKVRSNIEKKFNITTAINIGK